MHRGRIVFFVPFAVIIASSSRPAARAAGPEPNPDVTFHAPPKPLPAGARTHDWPAFLGPTHDGVAAETKLLRRWPAGGPPLVWEMKTGDGFSSPAIRGDRLVYFHRVGDTARVDCLHPETGLRHWTFTYPATYHDRYGFNNGPRASPIVNDGRVYTFGVEGVLHCLDLATGRLIWKVDTTKRFGVPANYFGVGSTPLVEGDRLIVQVGGDGGPCVVAFDKATGKVAWTAGDQWRASYASPVPVVVDGRRRILVFAGGDVRPPTGGLLSIDPATGAIDFRFPFRSRRYESVNASNPVCAGDRVFLSTSYRTGGVLLALTADGKAEVVWKTKDFGAHFSTPIYRDGYLYGISGSARNDTALVCLDWKTGKQLWRHVPEWEETVEHNGKRDTVSFSTFRGAMIYADGRFLLLGELGHLLWVDLTPKGYRELQRARLFDAGETWCPPVLSRGLLYISQNRPDHTTGTPPRLLCYDLRGG